MRTRPLLLLTALLSPVIGWSDEKSGSLVFVEGGSFKNTRSNFHGKDLTLPSFYIGKHEVTQKEWIEIMGRNPSKFKGDRLPVEMVSWYDCIEYCNKRSEQEGLTPYYTIDKNNKDPNNENPEDELKWTITINPQANGYRLPTEAEWEYAAGGGQASRSHLYSGASDIDKAGWFWQNSGDEPLAGIWNWPAIERNRNRTHPVGSKEPNELGLYDMSGNVREWCWDWFQDSAPRWDLKGSPRGVARVWKGGGWLGGDFCCEPTYRSSFEPNSSGPDQGFRVCRNP